MAKNNDKTIAVIIETPRGSRNKYKHDPKTDRFKLSKVLPEGMIFPYDFGYVPGTKAEDGDPLDVLVLSDAPMFPGCEVECRLIGVIKAQQKSEEEDNRNDRVIAVADGSVLYEEVEGLSDLEPAVLKQIEAFFKNYQGANGVKFTVLGHGDTRDAHKVLNGSKKEAA